MSFLINKSKARFQPAEIVETTSYLKNVPWGWYHIYPFPLEKQPDFDELYWCLYEKEMLVHVVVDIGAYRDGKIPKEAQKNLADILSFFKENEKEMLLRVVYDREGQGLMREPDQIGLVEQHMQQLGEVFMPYHRHIRVMQGLLVGNWGEMHGSRFLSREKLRMLLRIWKEALGTDIPVAVRTPQQWRMLHEEDARPGHTGVGLFNDGMFGSDVDLGTYGWKEKEAASWEEGWCRRDELPFVRKIGRHIPYGGEAVGTASEGSLANAVEEMKCTGVSYLNAAHDKKRLELWKQSVWKGKGVWNGISGYDYIGAHLGFRPVVRKITGKLHLGKEAEEMLQLQIQIENVGFSCLYEDAELVMVQRVGEQVVRERRILMRSADLRPGKTWDCAGHFPVLQGNGDCAFYAQLYRIEHKKYMRFANHKASEWMYLGVLKNE